MEPKPSSKLLLKTNFTIKHNWEPFYTGGSVVACDDGKTLLCSCGDSVQVIEVETGAIKCSLSQDGDDVTCLISSPDNTIIVSATRSLLLKQWKINDNNASECVRTWKAIHTSPIMCMDFDATSTLLATGSSDSTIKVWDMLHQYCTHNLRGSQGVITTVKFHPNDLKLFSASNDYAIRMWDLHSSRCLCMLNGHVSAVTSLAFHQEEDSITLISGGRDSVLCFWDLRETEQKTVAEPSKTIPVYETLEKVLILPPEDACKFSKDEAAYVLTAGNSGNLKVWNCKSGKCVHSQKAKDGESDSEQRAITELLHLNNGRYAVVTFDHNISIFNLDNKGFSEDKHLVGYNDEVLDVKFIGPKDSHVIVATNSPLVKVFDLKSSSCQLLNGHQDTVLCLDVFKDHLTFISGSKDNSVRLWKMDEATSKVSCISVGKSHTHAVSTLASPSLKINFLVSGSHDLTLKIWKITSTTNEDGSPTTALKVKHAIKAHGKDINSVAISPNDKFVASGSQDKTAKLWNVLDGGQLGTFRGHKRGIWGCQFSPSDQVLGTSSADGTIKLWSLSDFTCLKTFEGHDCSVLKMIFISKGTQIMTSGSNGLMKLWNIKSSECVKTLEGHDDKVWGLAVNADDNIVLSGAADSKIIQWEDVTEKERQEAKHEEDTVVLRQQELNNLIHAKRFAKAFKLAITLEQPFTALKVLKEMKWEDEGDEAVKNTITRLRADQKDTLLKFVMSWNTNSRNCHEAQKVLNLILKVTHPHELMEYSNAQTAIEALIPYTERHYQRMSRLIMNTTFVNYVWQMMKLKPVSLPATNKKVDDMQTDGPDESGEGKSGLKRHPLKMRADITEHIPAKRIKKPDAIDESQEHEGIRKGLDEEEETKAKEPGFHPIGDGVIKEDENNKKTPNSPSKTTLRKLEVHLDKIDMPVTGKLTSGIDERKNSEPRPKMKLRSSTKSDAKLLTKKSKRNR